MTKFRLFASEAEIKFRELRASGFKPGETEEYSLTHGGNADTETLGMFDTKEEALAELEKCGATTFMQLTSPSGKYYLVREYGVEELELDEDGDVIQGEGVWAYSPAELPEEVLA